MLALVLAAATMVTAAPASGRAAEDGGVCLALSGGGARGLAHIGVLQALEDEGVRVRCVAGTSMGALVGALYVSGYSPARMRGVVRSLEWQRVFSGRPERALVPLALRVDETPAVFRLALIGRHVRLPPARDSDYRINRFLFQLLAEPGFRMGGDFGRFPVPLRTVATELGSGARVVIAGGSLARAVRASLSTPVNLLPVTIGGRLVVDGGLVDNLPTDVARDMGSPVVAVDVRSTPLVPHAADSFVDTTAVVIDQLMRARNDASFTAADLTIDLRPGLTGLRAGDYLRHEEAFDIGLREGRRRAAEVQALAGGAAPLSRAAAGPALEGGPIAEIAVRGVERVRQSVITRAFGKPSGGVFRMDDVLRRMDAVYATELFQSVWLEAAPAPSGGAVIAVAVQEAPRSVVEAGGGYDPGDNARGFLRVRNRNLLGRGERIDTTGFASEREFGAETAISAERPFALPVGIFLRAHLLEEKPRVFRDHQSLGRAEFDRRGISAGLQRQVGAASLVRMGAEVGDVRTRAVAGLPFAAGRDRIAAVVGEAAFDTLDDRALPTAGAAVSVAGEHTFHGFGDDFSYSRLLARAQAAARRGGRFVARAQALAATSSGDVPVYEEFRIGGPVLLPGFHRDELWGRHALAGSVSAGVAVAGSLRLVARAGAGDVWEERRSAGLSGLEAGYGLGIEVPTRIGPFTVDWGRSAHGVNRVDVALGLPREPSLIR